MVKYSDWSSRFLTEKTNTMLPFAYIAITKRIRVNISHQKYFLMSHIPTI